MVALVLQFLLYNSDTVGSLNPTANNHIQTTSFTLQVYSYTQPEPEPNPNPNLRLRVSLYPGTTCTCYP